MPICLQCQKLMAHDQSRDGLCPNCQPQQPEGDHWSNVARVPNLAEAGYLVSLLEHQQIEARLEHSESFSAASGTWSSDFVLQVPNEQRSMAAEVVRSEAEALRNEQPELDEFGERIAPEPLHFIIWRPLALMALASLATLWLGQRFLENRGRNAQPRSSEALTEAMASIGHPMIAISPDGKVTHRLTYRAEERVWLLESDTNHDGRFDRTKEFTMTTEE